MAKFISCDQRSDEWFAQRWRRITGSEFKLLMGTDAARRKLAIRKRYEVNNPVEVPEQIQAAPLLWGIENESRALAGYELLHGDVETVGFAVHPEYDFIGFSPDGINGERGIEVKCPYNTDIHLSTWMLGMPKEHQPQVQGGMWVCERDEWDFISFDPRVPPPKDFYCQTIRRDEHLIKRLEINALRVWDLVMSDKEIGAEPDEIPNLFG